ADQAHAVAAASGQGEPELLALGGQKGVGRLQQDPRPVARVLLCPGRAAVLEVQEHFEGFDDDVVRRPPLDVGDEPESAGIMLERRVVKPLAGRITCFYHRHLLRSRTSARRRAICKTERPGRWNASLSAAPRRNRRNCGGSALRSR